MSPSLKPLIKLAVAASISGGALLASPAAAEEAGGWNYAVTPYLYATSMSGQSQIGPIIAPINVRFGDLLDHLSWAAMGNFNAQGEQWAFNIDLMYAKLGGTGPRELFSADIAQGIYAGIVAKRIHKHAEVYAGARFVTLDLTLNSNFGPGVQRSRDVDWVDPIVGMRVNAPISDKVAFNFMADVGGFGVGADYDIQVWPSLQIRLGEGRWRADVGWRINYLDYNSDSGAAYFAYDMLLYGPTLGIAYTF